MAADNYVNVGAASNLLVFAHREMCQRHHRLDAAPMNFSNHLSCGFTRVEKLHVRPGPRGSHSLLKRQSEYSYLYTVKLPHHIRKRIAKWLARFFVNDVGNDPLEFGFLHSLEQHIGTKVELMVADC